MNVPQPARMTVHGRALLVSRVCQDGWRVVDAATAAGVSERTDYKWLARFRAGGERMLHDRSSAPTRPHRCLPAETLAAVERLRREIETNLVEGGETVGGIGEVGPVAIPPAFTNASFAATGERLRAVPVTRFGYSAAA